MARLLNRRPLQTVKERLSRYFALVLAMTCAFMTGLLGYALNAVHICNDTLEAMTAMEAFFDGCAQLQETAEGYLLYGEPCERVVLAASAEALDAQLARLTHADVGADFARSVTDMRAALGTAAAGIAAMPETAAGRQALADYYETDYAPARSALTGILLEEPGLSARLLSAGAQLQARLTRSITRGSLALTALVALWAVLMVCYGAQLGRVVSRPIERLTQGVLRNGSALEPVTLDAEGGWEVENLTAAFNEMIGRIAHQWQLLQEKAELEKTLHERERENLRIAGELKSSQMQALQRQINPHFLFNTLNNIMNTADMEEAPETRELLSITASYLRYSLDFCEKQVTLGRELQELGNYVALQEKRFGERIRFEFTLDESLSGVRMPAMVLQPLVENAVAHGVGAYASDARIEIVTSRGEDGGARIEVRDNGVGMSAAELDALRERLCRAREDAAAQEGIGLTNVARRLHVFYHGQAALDVRSEPGGGTCVTLRLPPSS